MSSSNARNIVELRQLLAEKFPGVKMTAEPREMIARRWPTGVAQFDSLLEGGFAKGAITEIVSNGMASGGSLLLTALMERVRQNGEWLGLIDASNSFCPDAFENDLLSGLLWVRCDHAKNAMKAADLLLHDGTLSLLVLDLVFSPRIDLRRIPSSTWFRLQRILENTSTALIVFCPEPMVSNAASRVTLEKRFSLESLEQRRETLLAQVAPAVFEPGGQRIVKIA